MGKSQAHLKWVIPADTPTGTYRMSHFGYYKKLDGTTIAYSGTTNSFDVSQFKVLLSVFKQ